MKEQLIKYWERKRRQVKESPQYRKEFAAQSFGALDFALDLVQSPIEEAELIKLWNNEWRDRFYEM